MVEEPLSPDLQALLADMETYDQSVEARALEAEIDRTERLFLPAMNEHRATLLEQRGEIYDLFQEAYADAELARARFDQTAVLHGIQAAVERLREAPTVYGDLRGRGLFQFRERREARHALAVLSNRAGIEQDVLRSVERSYSRGGDPVPAEAGPPGARLEAALARVYEDPRGAWRRFEAVERRMGTLDAATGLARSPEGLGRLRPEVRRSEVLRQHVAREAATAAATRQGRWAEPGDGTLLDRHLARTEEKMKAFTAAYAEAERRVEARMAGSDHLRGLYRTQIRSSLEKRLQALSGPERERVIRAFDERLRARGRTATEGTVRAGEPARHPDTEQQAATTVPTRAVSTRPNPTGPVSTRPPPTKTPPSKTVSSGRALRPSGARSAAYALALRVASRGLQRGAAEITGRDTFSW